MRRTLPMLVVGLIAIVGLGVTHALHAAEGYLTVTFGASPTCQYPGTLKQEGNVFRFDLSALAANTRLVRATLTVPAKGHKHGVEVRVGAVGLADPKPLALRPPAFRSFDATSEVSPWLANPATNKGFIVIDNGGVDFREAVLEVSFLGQV